MAASVTSERVWKEIEKRSFAVLSYVTPRGEARSAGIVYVVRGRRLCIRTAADAWKTRHIRLNPSVALNVTIAKRIPFMPWIRIPAATIAFNGTARVIDREAAEDGLAQAMSQATGHEAEGICFIEVTPVGHFLTYGVGVPLLDMRTPAKARARVPVD